MKDTEERAGGGERALQMCFRRQPRSRGRFCGQGWGMDAAEGQRKTQCRSDSECARPAWGQPAAWVQSCHPGLGLARKSDLVRESSQFTGVVLVGQLGPGEQSERLKETLAFTCSIQTMDRASWVMLVIKNLSANVGDIRHRFNPWVGKIP